MLLNLVQMLSKGKSLIGGITPLIYTVSQVDKEIIRNEILWLLCRICKCIYYFTKSSFILEVLKNRFCKCKNSKSMARWPLKICTVLCPKCICVYGDTLCYKVTVCHISVVLDFIFMVQWQLKRQYSIFVMWNTYLF